MTPLLVAILALSESVTLALEFLAFAVFALGIAGQKLPGACRLFAQGLYPGLALGFHGVVCAVLVLGLVQGHDLVGSLLQSISPVAQLFMGAAALFAGVAGELDAIDGKHIASDQSLGVTGHQDLTKERFDLRAQAAYKFGDVGMAGLAVTADGDELDVALARLFNDSTGDQALAVGQQHDLEHDARIVGTGAHFVVLEPGIQCAEIEFVIDQVVQCEGKAAGDDLLRQDHRQ